RRMLVERMPVRVLYSLTIKGRELREIFIQVHSWMSKWKTEDKNTDPSAHEIHCPLCRLLPELNDFRE
ncbi:MAG TPA: winged helix-turn-helix transcriptional regulator, partial [Candidatus Hodarchaeales archaeon]|nr:winged helix-turn-helix transcriptional regulator [Candidatus Hodarchaeales archaeon]